MDPDRFAGKVAIVTGAAQGIGRAAAIQLSQGGAKVVVVDRVEEAAEQVRKDITAAGGQATVVVADLETDSGAVQCINAALKAHGMIDIAVHNVGGTMWTKPFWEYSVGQIEREIRRSLWPTLLCCRAVVPVMIQQRRGAIVNIGSVATRGIHRVPYAAAKGGVSAITVALSMEVAAYNIRVNCVAPGGIASNRIIPRNTDPLTDEDIKWREEVLEQTLRDTPMGRSGQAQEVASAIAFLASDEASYITGHVMYVSGGGIG